MGLSSLEGLDFLRWDGAVKFGRVGLFLSNPACLGH
jgi:hypothetical protein